MNRRILTSNYEKLMALYMSNVVAAVKSRKCDLGGTNAMDAIAFCWVCPEANDKFSICERVKKLSSFIRTNKFSYCRNCQAAPSTKQTPQQQEYQRCRNCPGGWPNYSCNVSFSGDETPSIVASNISNGNSSSHAVRLCSTSTDRISSRN